MTRFSGPGSRVLRGPAACTVTPPRQTASVDITRLRVQVNQEYADLGPEPADPHEREPWAMERAAAVMLLAEIADRNAEVLRHAADGPWVAPAARNLLTLLRRKGRYRRCSCLRRVRARARRLTAV